jgi:LPXTG-motif cell wall-anchored protein
VPPALLAGAATGAGVAGLAVLGGVLTATPWLVVAGALAVLVGGGYAVARRRAAAL